MDLEGRMEKENKTLGTKDVKTLILFSCIYHNNSRIKLYGDRVLAMIYKISKRDIIRNTATREK